MHQLSSFKQATIILFLSFACSPSAAFANGFSFSAATDFTTGNYGGTKSTDIWYVPFTARYDKDRASFRVIIPYLNITGPGNVLGPGIGGIDGSGSFISGGGIVVCDETNNNCSERTPARSGSNSGSGGSNSGSSGNSGSGNNSGPGSNSGSGNNNDASDDGAGSGNSGGNDGRVNSGSNSGSGGDNDGSNSSSEDGSGSANQSKQNKIAALGLVGGIPLGTGESSTRSTQSGLGDIITAFSYNLIDHAPSGIAFDITARLKIPTANANQNLGTGQVDYAIQGDLFKTISQFTLSATFGYRVLGNPSGITFHNVLYGAASVGYRLSPSITLGTSYNMGQSPVRLQDSRDLTLYLSQRVSDNFRLNIYGLKGFSERSPDWGGGINIRYVF